MVADQEAPRQTLTLGSIAGSRFSTGALPGPPSPSRAAVGGVANPGSGHREPRRRGVENRLTDRGERPLVNRAIRRCVFPGVGNGGKPRSFPRTQPRFPQGYRPREAAAAWRAITFNHFPQALRRLIVFFFKKRNPSSRIRRWGNLVGSGLVGRLAGSRPLRFRPPCETVAALPRLANR